MLSEPTFQALLAEVSVAVREEQDHALRDAERERFRQELSGTVAEHLDAMAGEDRRMFTELRAAFDSPDVPRQEKFKFWQQLHAFTEQQRARYAGTLGESWQAQLFVECIAEAFTRTAGADISGRGLRLANKLYQERAAARVATAPAVVAAAPVAQPTAAPVGPSTASTAVPQEVPNASPRGS